MKYSSPRRYDYESRYGKYRQITVDRDTYTETFNQTIIPKSDEDRFHIVSPNQINRPDIIAQIYYNDPTWYWVILLANDIVDPFTIDAGTILRIPPISSLYNDNGPLEYYSYYL